VDEIITARRLGSRVGIQNCPDSLIMSPFELDRNVPCEFGSSLNKNVLEK
jgi:hypothetical protein